MTLRAKYKGEDKKLGVEGRFVLKNSSSYTLFLSMFSEELVVCFAPNVTAECVKYSTISSFLGEWEEILYA